jgi:ornithine--oxo-acid transaminase
MSAEPITVAPPEPAATTDPITDPITEPVIDPVALEDRFAAHTYHPLPVTLVEGRGSWVTDGDGGRYLDLLSAYSALNFGHRHPRLTAVAHAQLDRLTLTSRAFHNDQLGPLCEELAHLVGLDAVIPMNTGAEAVESAIKAARRWAYDVKGVAPDRATIITAENCFHGRTTTIIGFSTDPDARRGFGPFTPGFVSVPFGDAPAIEAAIDDTTAAVLIEPVQGATCATATACCSSPTRSSPGSVAPGAPWPVITKAYDRTWSCWARRWGEESCRSRRWWRATR